MDTNQGHTGAKQGIAIFFILLGLAISYTYQGLSKLMQIARAGSGSSYDPFPLTTAITPMFVYGLSAVFVVSGLTIVYLTVIVQTAAVEKNIFRFIMCPIYVFVVGGLLLWIVSLAEKFLT